MGSSLARLGVKAARDRARVPGLRKQDKKSYGRRAETRGPLLSSRPCDRSSAEPCAVSCPCVDGLGGVGELTALALSLPAA